MSVPKLEPIFLVLAIPYLAANPICFKNFFIATQDVKVYPTLQPWQVFNVNNLIAYQTVNSQSTNSDFYMKD